MKARVLIADDSVHMRMILKDMLIREGYDVVGEAEDGEEAVRLYEKLKPDVVTLDISMPAMDGIEALKAIKSGNPDAKVVMVCAMNQQNQVIEAIRAGAADFFIKPLQSERVKEALERSIA
ncbi:MAG: response regulator [Synergistaceae bacterium]|nr:response regulator [Synergistaceae bacterium]